MVDVGVSRGCAANHLESAIVIDSNDPSALILKSSFPPAAAPDARVLILGSLPGERSLAEQRYYAHPQNQFWRLLSPIVGSDLAALDHDARLVVLKRARIALWDVVATARRTGSTDATIRDTAVNDLPALLERLPALRAVAFNGGKALALGRAMVAGRDLVILPLPSSSPLHTIGLAAKQPAWNAIAAYLS
jgi:hypoxanthine-DNA glycosylase